MWRDRLYPFLPAALRPLLAAVPCDIATDTRELRVRCGRPMTLCGPFPDYPCQNTAAGPKLMENLLQTLAQYGLYAQEDCLRHGLLSLPGGFRAGVCGRMSNGRFIALSSVCIRIPREKIGLAKGIIGPGPPKSMLIAGPPGSGKTTLLRDIVRLLAQRMPVGLVDERGEVAACHEGRPGLDVGPHCDILEGCPKAEGFMWLLRSMAPRVLAADELGHTADAEACRAARRAGVAVAATVHASPGKLPVFLQDAGQTFDHIIWLEPNFKIRMEAA